MAERKTYTAEDFKGCNGRRVTIEGVLHAGVANVMKGCVGAMLAGRHYGIPVSAIVEILPAGIGVGDLVSANLGVFTGRVEAVARDHAWVSWGNGAESVYPLSDLTLVERG